MIMLHVDIVKMLMQNIKICSIYSLLLVYVSVVESSNDAAGRIEQLLDPITPESNNLSTLMTAMLNLQMKLLQDKLTKALPGKSPAKVSQNQYGKLAVNPENVPSARQGEIDFQNMCDANRGYDNNYEQMGIDTTGIRKCFGDIIMISSKLPRQIEEAKPKGNLDEVFQAYCSHLSEFKNCLYKSLVDVIPCLTDDQKLSVNTMQNITNTLLTFSCENGGDHLALFTAEKGPDCIISQQPGIVECFKKNMNMSKTDEILYEMLKSNSNFPELNLVDKEHEEPFSFIFDLDQCRTAYKIRTCIVENLKNCTKWTTPVNVVESIFDNLIQKSTTCAQYSRSELDPTYKSAAASYISTSILSVVIPFIIIILAF